MIKNFVIAVLLVVVILFLITNPTYKSSVIVKTDTLYQQKTFTKYKKGSDIYSYVIKTDSVFIPVHDTIKIVSDYSRVYSYLDTIRLDTNNVVFIQDTITQNRIIGRGFSANLSEKTIIETRTITPKPKNALYLGVLADLRQDKSLQGVGIGLMLKVKDRALIGLGFDSNNFIRTSFYFKL
jgi:hypothetical protein